MPEFENVIVGREMNGDQPVSNFVGNISRADFWAIRSVKAEAAERKTGAEEQQYPKVARHMEGFADP